MTFRPIRVRVPLRTPLLPGRIPVSFDGLVWHALYMRHCCPNKAAAVLPEYLAQDRGVFRASCMAFGVYPGDQPLIATETATVGVMRHDDLLPEHFAPNGRANKYAKLQTEGGPYKTRLTTHKTYFAPEITWDAVGDGDALCALLNFVVFAVGREAKRGFGSVGKFRWEPLDHDTSWLADESTLARVLPSRIVDELDIQPENAVPVLAQTIPPYRNQAQERCLMPAGLRTVRVNKAL